MGVGFACDSQREVRRGHFAEVDVFVCEFCSLLVAFEAVWVVRTPKMESENV